MAVDIFIAVNFCRNWGPWFELTILGHHILRPLQSVAEPGRNQHQDLDPYLRQARGRWRFV